MQRLWLGCLPCRLIILCCGCLVAWRAFGVLRQRSRRRLDLCWLASVLFCSTPGVVSVAWGWWLPARFCAFSLTVQAGAARRLQRCGCACLGSSVSLCRGACVPVAAAVGCAGSGSAFRCLHVSGWDTAACTFWVAPCSLHALCLSAPQLCVLAGSSSSRVGLWVCCIGGVASAPGHVGCG